MDQVTYLKRFNEICSDKFLLIEHLDDIEVPDAKKYLDKIALELNIKWENSEGAQSEFIWKKNIDYGRFDGYR